MTIVSIHGQAVKTKSIHTCIEDIGPGGLKFVSSLKLPVASEILLEFELHILNETHKLLGWVVRKQQRNEGAWEYGVQFHIDEITRKKYIALLNDLSIRVYKYKMLWSYRACMEKRQSKCLGK
jgi:hypothetical protein